MKNKSKTVIAVIITFYLGLSSFIYSNEVTARNSKVAEIVNKFPAGSAAEKDSLSSELLRLGEEGILKICRMLTPPGSKNDTKVRFALSGVTTYVASAHAGAERNRTMYTKALVKALTYSSNKEVKAFLIRQLQRIGKKESVKPLRTFLSDNRLCEPATQALVAIGSLEAEKALLRVLATLSTQNRITVVKALGEMRSKAATRKILKFASSNNMDLRRVSLYALANIGDPLAEGVLSKVKISMPYYERAKAPSLFLLYAQRLAESGRKPQCIRICRDLIKNYTAPHENNIPCTALSILARALGDNVLEDLIKVMDSPNKELRSTALQIALSIRAGEATNKWIKKAKLVPAEIRAEIIFMLGERGDKSALPFLLNNLLSNEIEICLTTVPAVAKLGGNEIFPDLISLLQTEQEDLIAVLKQVLLSFPSNILIPEAARILEKMPPKSRIALIEILGKRRAKEYVDVVLAQTKIEEIDVRLSALAGLELLVSEKDLPRLIKMLLSSKSSKEILLLQNAVVASANQSSDLENRANPILEAIKQEEGKKRADLIRTLFRIGGDKALLTVVAETKNENPKVQTAAVFVLSNWPDFKAVQELLDLCKNTNSKKYLNLASQGLVRLVNESDLAPQEKLSKLKEAYYVMPEVEERSIVLSGIAGAKIPEAFRFISSFLNEKNIRSGAALALVKSAFTRIGPDDGLPWEELMSTLKKASWLIEDSEVLARIERYISNLLRQRGFRQVFNGRDLSGWKGLVGDPVKRLEMTPEELEKAQTVADDGMQTHWKVVDGILVFDGKGHSLCTAKDYTDFEMFVDWKIEGKGDSGIYLRGSPQVQIWDPDQWPEGSGGLYNNKIGQSKPLKVADNPIGEWNTFRIKMIGERVSVFLNNVLVVDNIVMENYWARDKPIYPTGQIELQSHSSPLYFKNIFIREILPEKKDSGLTEEEIKEEFVMLFNGKDLSGWTGDTEGYVAEDEKIVIYPKRGSGNLYTENEYSDFILRFEFKLSPGANNGLGIRAPLKGDTAYVGMELQILDNTADKYKNLKPYQYHGSIYGVVPARRGYLRPVGEWNEQEVTAKGRQITVKLNGVTIVDADIDEVSKPETMNDRNHPGLKRERGHIGFLGHGSRVEFRNLRIKVLEE